MSSTLAIGTPNLEFAMPDSEEPVTLAEAKLAARVDGDDLDMLIEGLISAAREQAEHVTGRIYRTATRRYELRGWPSDSEPFYVHAPASCAVTYWDGASWVELEASAFAYAAGGIGGNGTVLAPAAARAWPELGAQPVGPRVRVDITAGPASRDVVPECVKLYIKSCVATWINNGEALINDRLQANPLHERLLDRERLWG